MKTRNSIYIGAMVGAFVGGYFSFWFADQQIWTWVENFRPVFHFIFTALGGIIGIFITSRFSN
jgi:hypothetical protein